MASREQPDAVLQLGTDSDAEAYLPAKRSTTTTTLVGAGLLVTCLVAAAASMIDGRSSHNTPSSYSDVVELVGSNASAKDESMCSWGKQNCNATKCCNNPGMICYEQSEWYAQCRPSCVKAPDPTHWDAVPWTCKELGERSPGDGKCSDLGEDCRESQCCTQTNTQCFVKNKDWATCKSECIPGSPDLSDSNGDPWTCEKLGPWTQGAAPWVAQTCSVEGDDCSSTKCCATPGMQCFKQSDFWAQCKYDCQPGKDPARDWEPEWSCDELGMRTPGEGGTIPGKVSEWVTKKCVNEGADCRESRCCLGMNHQCYEKNKDWAMCMDDCTYGRHKDDNNETWSCKTLGPRTVAGLATKGSPSLFCWSLFQTTTYENDIIKNQMSQGIGIFACDEWALLSTAPETLLGETPDKLEAKSIHADMAEITMSVDGTAGNAKLFINCWNALIADGRWQHHAWIIKVDPDAVIVADRVRNHLAAHILENVYVVNCNKFPESPNFPMMYGSVEIYSYKAIDTYRRNKAACEEDMGMMLSQWGEDYYMTHCLDHIGVGRISDFASVGDNVCTGGSCADQYFSAFHPFKDVDSWQKCWDQAMGKVPADPPQW